MNMRILSVVSCVGFGFLGACAATSSDDGESAERRQLSLEQTQQLFDEADEVVPLTDVDAVTFRSSSSSCGVTVSSQVYGAYGQSGASEVEIQCTHKGCAGSGCIASGCQPGRSRDIGPHCTAPLCTGAGCQTIGCTMTTWEIDSAQTFE